MYEVITTLAGILFASWFLYGAFKVLLDLEEMKDKQRNDSTRDQ